MVNVDEHPRHEQRIIFYPRVAKKGSGGEQWNDKVQGEVNYCAGLASGLVSGLDSSIRGLERVTGSDFYAVVRVHDIGENRIMMSDYFGCCDMGVTRGMSVADQSDIVILAQGGTAGCVDAIFTLQACYHQMIYSLLVQQGVQRRFVESVRGRFLDEQVAFSSFQ